MEIEFVPTLYFFASIFLLSFGYFAWAVSRLINKTKHMNRFIGVGRQTNWLYIDNKEQRHVSRAAKLIFLCVLSLMLYFVLVSVFGNHGKP